MTPDNPPILFSSTGYPVSVSIFIALIVFMAVIPSAPASSATLAVFIISEFPIPTFTNKGLASIFFYYFNNIINCFWIITYLHTHFFYMWT